MVLASHGLFLAGCGLYGYKMSGFAAKAMHSAWAGLGACAALGVCSALSISGSRALYMVGVHAGLLLQLVFSGVFGLQAFRSYGVPEKADRFPLFVVMGAGSLGALYLMIKLKPKKKKE